jgi:hypothetical protein
MAKQYEYSSYLQQPQKSIELSNVSNSNTVIYPRAVMIVSINACLANKTVKLLFSFVSAL